MSRLAHASGRSRSTDASKFDRNRAMRATPSPYPPHPADESLRGPVLLFARMPAVTPFSVDFVHRVVFTRGLFAPENPVLIDALRGGAPRAVALIDEGVARTHPDIESRLRARLALDPDAPRILECRVVPGGEPCKGDRSLVDLVVELVHRHHLCRRSWVLAVGGGAVLDAVGYGAAIAHRGVRLVRIPTTVLAQDDAAMGVKNGINRFRKKNFEGVFSVPWAVLNDFDFLTTLPDTYWRGGFSEAVKISLLKDRGYFEEIESAAPRILARDLEAALPVIRRCADLHLAHIVLGGDPFELNEARPLDYGHWAAHKLEQLTDFAVSHGEAVAIGVALDSLYSSHLGWLPTADAHRVVRCLQSLGLPVWHPMLESSELLAGLDEFREHLGGRLCVTLLKSIGRAENVDSMDRRLVALSAVELRSASESRVTP